MLTIRHDDLTCAATQNLLALHLAAMHENSTPGSVFALDLSGLRAPGVTVWSVWQDEEIAGIGALKELGQGSGEVKSMRTHPGHLRKGVATLLLAHLVTEAKRLGMTRLSLETGHGPAFQPAIALYRRHGFVEGAAFSDYTPNGFSRFLHLAL